jgi:hypothetical protein
MKRLFTPILILIAAFAQSRSLESAGFEESVNHAPDFQVYQYDPTLKQIFGSQGGDKLCWPSSLAHRMIYFQRYRVPAFPGLHLNREPIANVQQFVRGCHTSLTDGTSQNRKVPCILEFFRESHYPGMAFLVGRAATDPELHRAVRVEDLRDAIRKDYGVILHVGWFKYDSRRRTWIERGSHSLNAYGYDYDHAWGEDHINLRVANPGIDYSSRPSGQMYDTVQVSKLSRESGISYPDRADLVLSGPGFNIPNRMAVLEDIFVFTPEMK